MLRIISKKIALIVGAGIAVLLILSGFFIYRGRKAAEKQISASRTAVEMGTVVSMTAYAPKGMDSEQKAAELITDQISRVLTAVDELDRLMLSWRSEDSEIYRFNHSAADDAMPVSPELAEIIEGSAALARETGSAMDITLRPVIESWGIEAYDGTEPYLPPSGEDLGKAAAGVGIDHLTLSKTDSGQSLMAKDIPGLSLDLGAVGKGCALDTALEFLSDSGISGAVLAVGGSVLTYGTKGEPWHIGVRDPEGSPNDYVGILSVDGEKGKPAFVSTSGGYEKYVEYEGQILEHIIDGRTMRPAESDLYSVTILTADSGLMSDGLSTACYLLGMEDSKPLLAAHRAEAVFVTKSHQIFYTAGLAGSFSLSRSGYTLSEMP